MDQGQGDIERARARARAQQLEREAAAGGPPPDATSETTGDKIAGGLGALYNGLSLGAGSKIAGAVNALADAGGNPALVPAFFGLERDAYNAPVKQFAENHPVASAALNAAGSLPWAGVGKAVGAARSGWQAVAEAAKTGAKYGAASGLLSADNPEDAISGMAMGAGVGGVLGPAIGLPLGYAATKVAGLLGRAFPGFAARMGAEPAGAIPAADRLIRGNMVSEGVHPSSIAPTDVAPDATAMDLSQNVARLARAARNAQGASAQKTIDNVLDTRGASAAGRIQSALSEASGVAPEEFAQTVVQMGEHRAATAAPIYKAALERPALPMNASAVEDGPTLGSLMARPSMQRASAYTEQLAAERGEVAPSNVFKQLGLNSPEDIAAFVKRNPRFANASGQSVDFPTLHEYKLRLDEMLGYGRANGKLPDGTPATKKMLQTIRDTKTELLKIMDTHNKDYATARGFWAGDAAGQDAYESGRKFFSGTNMATEGAAELKDLSPSEQAMWRRGGITWLQDKIQKLASNPDIPDAAKKTNIVRRVLSGSEDASKAKLLFDKPADYERFVDRVASEPRFVKTQAMLQNSSSTAAQLNEQGSGISPLGAYYVGRAALTGQPWSIAHAAAYIGKGLGSKGIDPTLADAIAGRVTKQGPELTKYLGLLSNMPDYAANRATVNRGTAAMGGLLGGRNAMLLKQRSGQ